MNDMIREKCELLANNHSAIKKKFAFENDLMCVAAGLIFSVADREADVEKMAECRKILRNQTGLFSKLRKTVELAIISKMALSDDPERYIAGVMKVYEMLRKAKFEENSYMALAGMMICDLGAQDNCDEVIEKAQEILKRMEKTHPFLTSSEDTSFVILLALSYKDADTIIKDLEDGYEYFRKMNKLWGSKDAVQGLCEVLAVTYGDMRSKCDKVVNIVKAFKNRKAAFGNDKELPALGTLADIDMSPVELADEIIAASELLKEKAGFGDKAVNKEQRMMYAAMLIACAYGQDPDVMSNPMISNTFSIITAKRIANTVSIIINLATEIIPALAGAAADKKDPSGDQDNEIKK